MSTTIHNYLVASRGWRRLIQELDMSDDPKIGLVNLDGPAVRAFLALKDDNHSLPANEDEALANFDSFADSFFQTQNEFLKQAEHLVQGSD